MKQDHSSQEYRADIMMVLTGIVLIYAMYRFVTIGGDKLAFQLLAVGVGGIAASIYSKRIQKKIKNNPS